MAMTVITKKNSGQSGTYTVSANWISKLREINVHFDPAGRYREIFNAEHLFELRVSQ